MKCFLDTHVFIWYIQANSHLSPKVTEILEDSTHELYFSIASLWEISIKMGLGKLKINHPFHQLASLLSSLSITTVPITFTDTDTYLSLPLYHRDPFDRILIAQAINRNISIITADAAFDLYPINKVWD